MIISSPFDVWSTNRQPSLLTNTFVLEIHAHGRWLSSNRRSARIRTLRGACGGTKDGPLPPTRLESDRRSFGTERPEEKTTITRNTSNTKAVSNHIAVKRISQGRNTAAWCFEHAHKLTFIRDIIRFTRDNSIYIRDILLCIYFNKLHSNILLHNSTPTGKQSFVDQNFSLLVKTLLKQDHPIDIRDVLTVIRDNIYQHTGQPHQRTGHFKCTLIPNPQ